MLHARFRLILAASTLLVASSGASGGEPASPAVRVIRIKYGPRDKVVMHSHPAGLLVFLTDQHVRFTFPDGSSEDIRKKAGETLWMDAVTHQPENLTDQTIEVLYIEAK